MHLDNEIKHLRDKNPGCSQLVHLNNAGFSLSPEVVVGNVIPPFKLEQPAGGYTAPAPWLILPGEAR